MKFNFEATGIGSVPFKDPREACDIIFDNFPAIPFWPQLGRRSYLENMYVQYCEGMPGIVLDEAGKTIHVDSPAAAAGIEGVYASYLENDSVHFKVSEPRAAGLYEFLGRKDNLPKGVKFVKGHITGPISYALSLVDGNKRSILYDKELFDALTKVLVMKARWQIEKLEELSPKVIVFIDEPSLVSLGSSYVSINAAEAFEKLDEVIRAVKDEGALCGLHCCGNTDWPSLLKRDIDIISFDAYNFTKEFLLYGAELKEFLREGRTIAWGIVPTSEAVDKESPEGLAGRLKEAIGLLAGKGIERSAISSLVTPSCGTGTLDEKTAAKIFKMTKEVSKIMQG